MKIEARVQDLWLDMSFGPKWPKANVVSKPQTLKPKTFLRQKVLLDSSYDSVENEVLFVKIWARVLHLWLDMFFESK